MKKIFALVAVLSLALGASVNAATLTVDPTTTSPNGAYAIYLDSESTAFDTISVSLTPNSGVTFTNIDADGVDGTTPRSAGQEFTFINALLEAPPAFGGRGLTVVGKNTTDSAVAFDATILGQNIVTGGNMFLANVDLSPAGGQGMASVQLIAGGAVLETLTAPIGIPEPATFALAGLSLVGFVAARRRLA